MIKFSVTPVYLDDFEVKIEEADKMWSDLKQRIDLKMLTAQKDICLNSCYEWCKDLSLRFRLAFSKNDIVNVNFPSKQLLKAKKSEAKMIYLMNIIIELGEKHSADLLAYGQTPEVIQEGKDLLENLKDSDSVQELQKREKKEATEARHKKYNEIYDIINRLNEIGRNVFAHEPEKLLLFDSPWNSHHKKKSSVYEGIIEPVSTVVVAEDLDPETVLHIENTGETDLIVFVNTNGEIPEGNAIDPGTELTAELSELGEGKYLKIRNKDTKTVGSYKIDI
ncbi:MAG: hypothetical protein GY756_17645 [bacterium]|nr:hypothetical protein [bacterium]